MALADGFISIFNYIHYNMSVLILTFLKLIFIIFLMIFFTLFFGIPSLEKFLEGRTIYTEEKIEYSPSMTPTFLIHTLLPLDGQVHVKECFEVDNDFNKSVSCINNLTLHKDKLISSEVKHLGKILCLSTSEFLRTF